MKKEGILHKELLNLLCTVGHGDYIMVTDRGFPLPSSSYTRVIDLGLIPGYPDFQTVISTVLPEIAVDWLYFAKEVLENNSTMVSYVKGLLPLNAGISFMDHVDMKEAVLSPETYHKKTKDISKEDSRSHNQLLNQSRVIGFIRTGEFTKYTNILIECGVAF